jgi:hypothetical protein
MTPQHRRNIAAQINARLSKRTLPGRCWNAPSSAPRDRSDLEVQCGDESGAYALPFPCRLTDSGWINARTGTPVAGEVIAWRVRGW